MKGNIRHLIAALAAAAPFGLFAPAAVSQTIDFGALPAGPVAAGTDGFDWHGAINDPTGFDPSFVTAPSVLIDQFTGSQPFTLNSVTFENLMSEAPSPGGTASYSTVVSGYLNGTLEKSVTEDYGWGGASTFSGLDIAGVNQITFATTALLTDSFCCDSSGNIVTLTFFNGPDTTYVSSLNVSSVAKAPEMDPASAASSLSLLVGGLLVLRGRRAAHVQ